MFNNLLGLCRRHFGRDKSYYMSFYRMFGFTPYNIELYKLALIHKSASYYLEDGSQINNERLEYLGDAIIEAVTSDYLYIEFPNQNEGVLTQMRARIVSRQSLNRLSCILGLDRLVISSRSNHGAGKNMEGDAFEAIIGAIYLDMGYDFTNRLLINRIYAKHLNLNELILNDTDFKSRLIEWAQKEHHSIRFETSSDVESNTHSPRFLSEVYIEDMKLGTGVGSTKKEAEQRAAYSVSQGVPSDEQSEELLESVDRYSKFS